MPAMDCNGLVGWPARGHGLHELLGRVADYNIARAQFGGGRHVIVDLTSNSISIIGVT